MKKSTKWLFVLLAFFFVKDVNAKQMTTEDIDKISKVDETTNHTVYIFGKHVNFNVFKMSDIESAANTLEGATDAKIYYKDGANNWKYAVDDTPISEDEKSQLKFEMIKLIGEPVGNEEHVSANKGLYGEGYIGENKLPDSRIEEKFNDETSAIKVVNMREVKPINLDSKETTFWHKYNTESLNVDYSKGEKLLHLQEKRPLKAYGQGEESELFALLVETNRKIDISPSNKNVELAIKNYGGDNYFAYQIKQKDIDDAANHTNTPNPNEFLIWLDAAKLNDNSMIELTYIDEKNMSHVQNINIKYDKKVNYGLLSVATEKVPQNLKPESGVSVSLTEDYQNFTYISFYGDNANLKGFDVDSDNGKYFALAQSAEKEMQVYPYFNFKEIAKENGALIDGTEDLPGTISLQHRWNMNAFKLATVKDSIKNNTYNITITKDKVMEKYSNPSGMHEHYALLMDLGVKPTFDERGNNDNFTIEHYGIGQEDYDDAIRHGAKTDTEFVMWLFADMPNNMYTVTFENKKLIEAAKSVNIDKQDKYVFNFETKDEIKNLEMSYKLGKAIDLDNADMTAKFKHNMESITLAPVKYDESSDTYTVSIQANDVLEKYVGGNSENTEWMSLIADFGVDPKKITADKYGIEDCDITDAKRHGAITETSFVMWIDPNFNGETFTFRNELTRETTKVKFIIQTVETIELADATDVTVPAAFKGVRWDQSKKKLLVNTGVTSFEVNIDGNDYVYKKDGTWKQIKKLKLVAAYNDIEFPGYNDKQKYNVNSVKSVTVDGNKINVVLNRKLDNTIDAGGKVSNWYGLVVNLNVENGKLGTKEGYGIEAVDRTDANNHVLESNKSANNLVVWLTADATDKEKTITFYNTDDPTIEYPVIIKSTYVENVNMKLVSTSKIDTTDVVDKKDPYYENIRDNNKTIESIIKDNKIIISHTDDLIPYNNGYASGRWFGILLNLGIDPSNIEGVNYTIAQCDITDAGRFGGKKNDFVVWLSEEDFDATYLTLNFKNKNKNNKFDSIAVEMEFVKSEIAKLKTVKMATAVDVGEFTSNHKVNQASYKANINRDGNIVLEQQIGSKPVSYNNGYKDKTWIALLVDFGVDPNEFESVENGYGINPEDIKDASRHGASGNEFVMWVGANEDRDIQFKDKYTGRLTPLVKINKAVLANPSD